MKATLRFVCDKKDFYIFDLEDGTQLMRLNYIPGDICRAASYSLDLLIEPNPTELSEEEYFYALWKQIISNPRRYWNLTFDSNSIEFP